LFQEAKSLNYHQNLTDAELLRYASINAKRGSLAALLAERFAANVRDVAELEAAQDDDIKQLEAEHAKFIEALDKRCADRDARIDALEKQLDAIEDDRIESAIAAEMESAIDPLLE
jgi:hypothetical protein